MNIRTRLTLQFILISAGIFLTALLFIYRQFDRAVENEFFLLLETQARKTAEMVLRNEPGLQPLLLFEDAETVLPPGGNTLVFDEQYRCVYAAQPDGISIGSKMLLEIRKMGNYRFKNDEFSGFGLTIDAVSGRQYVVVAEAVADRSKLDKLRNILLLTFFFSMAAVAAGGWFYAGQALRPVSQIVGEVEKILPADLSRRLQSNDERDELGHLIRTFNRMLDRIERAFQMQRGFISNVSHELKNPIAVMDSQLQLARSKPRSKEEYERVLASLHDDVHEISDTTNKLLQLANVHSDAAVILFSEVRLDELLYQTRAFLLKTQPDYAIQIAITDLPENPEQLCVRGNEPLLRTALLNLFENGCKYSPDHRVEVSIQFSAAGQPEIDIFNGGDGIPEADLPHIFEPFFRSAAHIRLKGSGIGLSLVKSICELHRINMDVESGAGRGTRFRLKFESELSVK